MTVPDATKPIAGRSNSVRRQDPCMVDVKETLVKLDQTGENCVPFPHRMTHRMTYRAAHPIAHPVVAASLLKQKRYLHQLDIVAEVFLLIFSRVSYILPHNLLLFLPPQW